MHHAPPLLLGLLGGGEPTDNVRVSDWPNSGVCSLTVLCDFVRSSNESHAVQSDPNRPPVGTVRLSLRYFGVQLAAHHAYKDEVIDGKALGPWPSRQV